MARKAAGKFAANIEAITAGRRLADGHPLIAALPGFSLVFEGPALEQGADRWLTMACDPPDRGAAYWNRNRIPEPQVTVWPNLRRRSAPQEWAYVLARVSLHIAMNHIDPSRSEIAWHLAAWCRAEEMLSVAGVGQRPAEFPPLPAGLPRGDIDRLAGYFASAGDLGEIEALSLAARGEPYWSCRGAFTVSRQLQDQRAANLADGIRGAATRALNVAGGIAADRERSNTAAARARKWVISEYPLLAALASAFALVEDEAVCLSLQVRVAAISDQAQEIYVNPNVRLSDEEARFVMAHELLHAGLRHSERRQGRDAWFWNVACDYVINGWLIEMKVGLPPDEIGYLHDPDLAGQSAEEIYDRIVGDLRWMRRLRKARTLNGAQVDILEGDHPPGWWRGGGVDLDAFYRRSLSEGLDLHRSRGRGILPAGLVEEIRSLSQPPVPWDVKLGHWLDRHFPPLERRRSYARAHRRQSATPGIPRPAWIAPDEERAARVFGVVLDSSGSMARIDLGKAVGAIASYAMSRDVGFVRLVQCDAAAHDAGYVDPASLLEQVEIHGRGGTVLMPGIRLLEEARDFPGDAPVLIITDGACDRLTIRREHAFLLATGGRLPFRPAGPVFRME